MSDTNELPEDDPRCAGCDIPNGCPEYCKCTQSAAAPTAPAAGPQQSTEAWIAETMAGPPPDHPAWEAGPQQGEAVAWRCTSKCGLRAFMTQRQYDAQSPTIKAAYEPFRCANCSSTAVSPQQGEAVAWCALTPSGKIAHFDGKPMVMPGPVGNEHHPVALVVRHPAPAVERGVAEAQETAPPVEWAAAQNYRREGMATSQEVSEVANRRHGAFNVDQLTLAQWVDIVNCVLASRAALTTPAVERGVAEERAGIERAARWVEKRRDDFVAQYGRIDPDTGALEFGTGQHALLKEEYVGELSEIADGLLDLTATGAAQGDGASERIAQLEAEMNDKAAELEEARRAPWPEWAEQILKIVREFSGYDGYDDSSEGIDLPEEVRECLEEFASQIRRLSTSTAQRREAPAAQPLTDLPHSSESIERAFITLRGMTQERGGRGIGAVMMVEEQLQASIERARGIQPAATKGMT